MNRTLSPPDSLVPARPSAFSVLTGKLTERPHPEAISEPGKGGKFDHKGRVLPWPGNTIICHIDQESAAFAALVALQNQIKQSKFAENFTFLPPPSFHMTVFGGYAPFLHHDGYRPDGLSNKITTRDDSTQDLARRLKDTPFPRGFTIQPVDLFGLHSVTVCGTSESQEQCLRQTREKIRHCCGYTPLDFAHYVFHITLAYPLRWVDEDRAREIIAFSQKLGNAFGAAIPQIELGPCELCWFDNMHHFQPIMRLDGGSTPNRERLIAPNPDAVSKQ